MCKVKYLYEYDQTAFIFKGYRKAIKTTVLLVPRGSESLVVSMSEGCHMVAFSRLPRPRAGKWTPCAECSSMWYHWTSLILNCWQKEDIHQLPGGKKQIVRDWLKADLTSTYGLIKNTAVHCKHFPFLGRLRVDVKQTVATVWCAE